MEDAFGVRHAGKRDVGHRVAAFHVVGIRVIVDGGRAGEVDVEVFTIPGDPFGVRIESDARGLEAVFDLAREISGGAAALGGQFGPTGLARRFIDGIDIDDVARDPGEGLVVGVGGTGFGVKVGADGDRVRGDGLAVQDIGLLLVDFLVAGNGEDSRERKDAVEQFLHDLHCFDVRH